MTLVTSLVKRKLPSTFRIHSFFFINSLDNGDRYFIPILKITLKGLDEVTLKGGLSQKWIPGRFIFPVQSQILMDFS